jgi:hypothetical protein
MEAAFMKAQHIPAQVRPVTPARPAAARGVAGGTVTLPDVALVHRAAAGAGEPPAVAALRLAVLDALRGPSPRSAYAVPRRWPVVRGHVLSMVRRLHGEGLLERVAGGEPGGGDAGYRATAAGRAVLRVAPGTALPPA